MTRRDTGRAFRRVIDVLREEGIRFRVTGGLAARVYGSDRPLADIDLEVPDDALPRIAARFRRCVRFGPKRYRDASWDVALVTLILHGQVIDCSGADTVRIRNRESGTWSRPPAADLPDVTKRAYGRIVPVLHRDALVAYKRLLGRRVDVADLAAIARS